MENKRKAQGAFEYILLLGGVLLIVVIAVIILRGSVLNQSNQQVVGNVNAFQGATTTDCEKSTQGGTCDLFDSFRGNSISANTWNVIDPANPVSISQNNKLIITSLAPGGWNDGLASLQSFDKSSSKTIIYEVDVRKLAGGDGHIMIGFYKGNYASISYNQMVYGIYFDYTIANPAWRWFQDGSGSGVLGVITDGQLYRTKIKISPGNIVEYSISTDGGQTYTVLQTQTYVGSSNFMKPGIAAFNGNFEIYSARVFTQ